ncbi:MAG: hypothetical protein ACPF9D_10165 [Owenweeksia sp.]
MVSRKELRGFRIIKGVKSRRTSLKLMAMNGSRFIVMQNRYFIGLLWKTRTYEFSDLRNAEMCYEKLLYTKPALWVLL